MSTTPQTLAEKIIARAARRPHVAAGEFVTCRVDLAIFHDSSGPRRLQPMLDELGARLWDRDRIVLVIDHYLPAQDEASQRIVRIARDWARDQALPHVYDGEGICHVVVPQRGHLRPGMFCVGGDSHSPTGGAFGAYMFGIGATEMLGVVTSGEIWLQVPRTITLRWHGRLAAGVMAKDMMLHLIARFGLNGAGYQAVEFDGEAVRALPMQERMTLANMSAELGAQAGLIAPDATTRTWLAEAGAADCEIEGWHTDDGAVTTLHELDAAALAPQVAAPHSPANALPVTQVEPRAIAIAYVGACTGAKLADLRAAAEVLGGRRVAAGVRLMVAPASVADLQQARAEGTWQALHDAGAELLPSACGACAGYGGAIPDGATVISTTARNFQGRMGSASARVFLASPYTVAASALRGRIADPREVLP